MKPELVGRLAMRVEGDNWVAYYARPNTMDGAIQLGQVQMALVIDPDRKAAFIDFMRGAVGDLIKETFGADAHWPDPDGTPAPQHERAGRA